MFPGMNDLPPARLAEILLQFSKDVRYGKYKYLTTGVVSSQIGDDKIQETVEILVPNHSNKTTSNSSL